MWPSYVTEVPSLVSAPSTSAQQAANARAHRGEWKPVWSAPSIPRSVSRATSAGSTRK